MKKVTSISERNFLNSYLQDQKERPGFARPFFLGVTSSLLAPQLIFCFFFGSFFSLVFGACALGGGVLGLRSYRRVGGPFLQLNLSSAEQTRFETALKKAA